MIRFDVYAATPAAVETKAVDDAREYLDTSDPVVVLGPITVHHKTGHGVASWTAEVFAGRTHQELIEHDVLPPLRD